MSNRLAVLQTLYRLKALGIRYIDLPLWTLSPSSSTSWKSLHHQIRECHLCPLAKSRHQSMLGYGSIHADLVIIDGSVSQIEDTTNEYYAGASGAMVRSMIENVLGYSVEEVFYTHAIKCHPTLNDPQSTQCYPFLHQQLALIRPKAILALGEEAYDALSDGLSRFEQMRSHPFEYAQIPTIATHHPSHLTRNPSLKIDTLNDLKRLKRYLV